VQVIGMNAARTMLCDEATRLQHVDRATTDCAALVNRIDKLIRPA
jgi:hypothetical protein